MSVLTCAEVRELAPELALGILGGAERAEVVLHVNGCARCQAYVTELTEAADVIPQLVPEAEPPAGFETRVLRALGADRRRSRRRWVVSIAAVAAAVAILSVTVVRVIESGDTTTAEATPPNTLASTPVAVAMKTTVGRLPAGWAYINNRHGVAVTMSYAVPSGGYVVQVTSPSGHATTIGMMTITDNHGSWTGTSTRPITGGSTIALVDASGTAMCHGTVPTAE